MKESIKKSKAEHKSTPQEKLEPCVSPQSFEAKRPDKTEDACDDGVK